MHAISVRFLFLVASFLLASSVGVFAERDGKPDVSPDGRYAIYNIGDTAEPGIYFEIRAKDGSVLLTTNDKTGQTWRPTHANQIMWSPDSHFVVFAFDDGHQKSTAVYSFAASKLISLGHVDDGYTLPIRWFDRRTIVVENSTPMGAKALGGVHIWRQTFLIRSEPFVLECVYTGRTTVTEEVPYNLK